MGEKQVVEHELGICEFWLVALAVVGFIAVSSRCASRLEVNVEQVAPEQQEVDDG